MEAGPLKDGPDFGDMFLFDWNSKNATLVASLGGRLTAKNSSLLERTYWARWNSWGASAT